MTDQHSQARPGISARGADSVADAARASENAARYAGRTSANDIAESFADIVVRVGDVIEGMRAPGQPLDRLAHLTRKAPLAALATAFMLGVVMTRRR